MNIFQKINAVRKLIPYIQKDRSVSTGGGSYQAVSHDQVTAMVRPAMIKHGIVCYPVLVESRMNPPEDGAKQSRYEATYDFHFVNDKDPADRFIIRIQAHAMDSADKAPGKALSYAKKYAILKLMEIETGESDESRYQPEDDFPIEDHLAAIESSPDMDTLKTIFASSYTAAGKNAVAQKTIIAAKNARKDVLAKGSENAG